MLAHLAVSLYQILHGTLHVRGGGWILRRLLPLAPRLYAYPLPVPGVGVATVDFRDGASTSLLNYTLGDFGDNRQLLKYLGQLLQPGDVYWDIGANIGTISAFCAHPDRKLRAVHAFEPNPVALRTLTSLFQDNPVARVHPIALGNENGEMKLNVDPHDSHLGSVVHGLSGEHSQSVPIRIGDELINSGEALAPNVIKIDVEGFEPMVFAGLAKTIATCRPILFFEHIWLDDHVVRALCPSGYSLWFIGDDGSLSQEFQKRREGHDAIAMPVELVHLLPSAP